MTKDEALDLALEALEYFSDTSPTMAGKAHAEDAITAIKQALAQPAPVQEPVVMPENWFAGMPEEYRKEAWRVATPPAAQPAPVQEPVAWFKHGPYEDGEQLSVVFKNPHDDICYSPLGFIDTPPAAQPAPVQPVWIQPDHLQKAQKAPFLCRVEPHKRDDFVPLHTTPPAAQPAPVQEPVAWMYDFLNPDNRDEVIRDWVTQDYNDIEREVGFNVRPLYTTPPAQPAVPDAIHHTDLSEHPQYIEGWNDCRAEMLKGTKP
jgi:hypothetical protein